MLQVRVLSLRPYRVFITKVMNTRYFFAYISLFGAGFLLFSFVMPWWEDSGKYCVRCAEGKKDKKDKTVKAAGAAGGVAAGLVAVAGAALPIIKAIIKKE